MSAQDTSLCPYCDSPVGGILPSYNVFGQRVHPCNTCFINGEHKKYNDKNIAITQVFYGRSIADNLWTLNIELEKLFQLLKEKL